MITRIFKVKVHKKYITEFEADYKRISVPLVKSQKGLISVEIGTPMNKECTEYVMITHWKSLDALKAFVGEAWNKALIPKGMEKYIKECWISHYETD